jgi:hypothetical protein
MCRLKQSGNAINKRNARIRFSSGQKFSDTNAVWTGIGLGRTAKLYLVGFGGIWLLTYLLGHLKNFLPPSLSEIVEPLSQDKPQGRIGGTESHRHVMESRGRPLLRERTFNLRVGSKLVCQLGQRTTSTKGVRLLTVRNMFSDACQKKNDD